MPTDDLIPDWRVQVNLKFGPHEQHLLNVRADTFADLAELLDAAPDGLADKVASVAGQFSVIATVAQGTQGKVETVATATVDGTPRCAHGARTHRSGSSAKGPWQAFFCPQPKGQSQCDPIFKDKENEGGYPWR